MIRLIVCDDHDMVRTALVRVLELNRLYQVVAQASSRLQLLQVLEQTFKSGFDVLLLDLTLGDTGLGESFDLIRQILLNAPAVRIVVVSMHNAPDVVNTALQCGALGYVAKSSSIDVLQEAISHAYQGRRFLDPNLVESIVVNRRKSAELAWDADLTRREREIMAMLCDGQRVSDIASTLCLSIKTVSSHKIRMMEKLKIKSNADLIKLGMQHSLV
jgi:DNA-binding NarL/FixJ family response regulator